MIRILTDSTADIDSALAARLGVEVVPLRVLFGEEAFRDGVDLTMDAFYARLISCETLPTTSQPAPADFLPSFQAAKESGDSLIAILLSGALSGTCQSALIARDMAEYDQIYVVDSLSAICGLRLLVEKAAAMRDMGASPGEIVAAIEEMKSRVKILAVVDTLEYFFKGGRLSRAEMVAGSLLNMKPLITLKDGAVHAEGKCRGTAKAIAYIVDAMEKNPPADPGLPVYFGYTHSDDKCRLLMEEIQRHYSFPDTAVCPVGSVIGTHVGPGAGLVTYLMRK